MLGKVVITILVFLSIVNVQSQVCTRTKMSITTGLITHFQTPPDGDGVYRTQQKYFTKSSILTTKICCEGYVQEYDEYEDEELYEYYETSKDNFITCKPVCDPACINGECSAPGVCTCSPGYTSKANETHVCIPVCTGCEFGTCIRANTCVCFFGYRHVNGSCEPICTEPCVNGFCEAPEHCSCHTGYKKSINSSCEPDCTSECDDGFCIMPVSCLANSSTTIQPVNISDHGNWEEMVEESSWTNQHFIVITSSSIFMVLVVVGVIYMLTRVWRQRSQSYAVAQELPLNNSRNELELHRDETLSEQMIENRTDNSPTV